MNVMVAAAAYVDLIVGKNIWKKIRISDNPSILNETVQCYHDLFATEPKVRAIHAGLECGLFLEKYPHLEMVSFGPTLRGVHFPDERLEISTVDKFWKLLVELLKRIA